MSRERSVWTLDALLAKAKPKGGCLELHTTKLDIYPPIRHNLKNWRAHRLSLFLKTGVLPEGKWALHKCDNKKCINPEHLYWGTSEDNISDRETRRRSWQHKVTKCPYGHAYVGYNLRLDSKGKKVCRTCKRLRQRIKAVREGKFVSEALLREACDLYGVDMQQALSGGEG